MTLEKSTKDLSVATKDLITTTDKLESSLMKFGIGIDRSAKMRAENQKKIDEMEDKKEEKESKKEEKDKKIRKSWFTGLKGWWDTAKVNNRFIVASVAAYQHLHDGMKDLFGKLGGIFGEWLGPELMGIIGGAKDLGKSMGKSIGSIFQIFKKKQKDDEREASMWRKPKNILLGILALVLGVFVGFIAMFGKVLKTAFITPIVKLGRGLRTLFVMPLMKMFTSMKKIAWITKIGEVFQAKLISPITKAFESLKTGKISKLFSSGMEKLSIIGKKLGGFFTNIYTKISKIASVIAGNRFFQIGKFIGGKILLPIVVLIDFIKGWIGTDGGFFEKVKGGIESVAKGFIEIPAKILGWISDKILGLFGLKIEGGTGKAIIDGIMTGISTVLDMIIHPFDTISKAFDKVTTFFKELIVKDGIISDMIDKSREIFTAIWPWIKKLTPIGWIHDGIMSVIDFMKRVWESDSIFEFLKMEALNLFENIWTWMKENTPIGRLYDGIKWVYDYFSKESGTKWEWLDTLKSWVTDLAINLWTLIKTYHPIGLLFDGIKWVYDYFSKESGTKWEWLDTMKNLLADIVANLWTWIKDYSIIGLAYKGIQNVISWFTKKDKPKGESILDTITDKASQVWQAVKDWFINLIPGVGVIAKRLAGIGKKVYDGAKDLLTKDVTKDSLEFRKSMDKQAKTMSQFSISAPATNIIKKTSEPLTAQAVTDTESANRSLMKDEKLKVLMNIENVLREGLGIQKKVLDKNVPANINIMNSSSNVQRPSTIYSGYGAMGTNMALAREVSQ